MCELTEPRHTTSQQVCVCVWCVFSCAFAFFFWTLIYATTTHTPHTPHTPHTHTCIPTPESSIQLFEEAGFKCDSMIYDTRELRNRKRQINMYRVWVNGKFVKPLPSDSNNRNNNSESNTNNNSGSDNKNQ